jgi:hypothetical protein
MGTVEPGQQTSPAGGQELGQPPRVGQVRGDTATVELDGDPKAVVAPHKAACDQRWQFHTADYTTRVEDGK